MNLKLGCDPEVFLHNGEEFISAAGLFPGTKDEPFLVDKGMVQVDGLALEFGIDPASSEDEFHTNISTVLTQLKEMVREASPDFEIKFIPFARFNKMYFDSLPDECKLLGCDPDYDPWGNMKVPDETLMYRPFRSAGGHIHIGWGSDLGPYDPVHFEDCRFIAEKTNNNRYFKASTHEEKERVKYYGSVGSFRPKTYGVELRSPSNRWVETEEGRREVYRYVTNTVQGLSK